MPALNSVGEAWVNHFSDSKLYVWKRTFYNFIWRPLRMEPVYNTCHKDVTMGAGVLPSFKPPRWNDILYWGLWKAAILSPGCPPPTRPPSKSLVSPLACNGSRYWNPCYNPNQYLCREGKVMWLVQYQYIKRSLTLIWHTMKVVAYSWLQAKVTTAEWCAF